MNIGNIVKIAWFAVLIVIAIYIIIGLINSMIDEFKIRKAKRELFEILSEENLKKHKKSFKQKEEK